MVHHRARAASDSERWPHSFTSRGFMAMKRMRPSATGGIDRDSVAHKAGGASTATAGAWSLAATKSTRCCSHSCEWPSTSGSKTRISRLLGGGDGIEPVHEMAEDARLGIMRLDELAAAPAKLLAQAAVVGEPYHGFGEARRIVGRHAQEGTALALQTPQHAVRQGRRHEGTADRHDVEDLGGNGKRRCIRPLRHQMDVAGGERGAQRFVGLQRGDLDIGEAEATDLLVQLAGLVAVAAQYDLDVQPPVGEFAGQRHYLAKALLAAEIAAVQHLHARSGDRHRGGLDLV